MPDTWTCPETGTVFKTGATLTPRSKLQAAPVYEAMVIPPPQVAYVPVKRSVFGNDSFGDCVSAEEAFTKTVTNPEIDVDKLAQVCISWARQHGVLNGASLDEVLDWMREKGFQLGPQLYNDGSKFGVDYSDEIVLQSAISQGPVKIAMASSALPGGAGSRDGWYQLGRRGGRSDHCTALCGYGPAGWLYQQLGLPLPSALSATLPGYLLYTWATIGFVDHAWIMGTCEEAWVRNPTTIGIPPLIPPLPPPPPVPVIPNVSGRLYAETFTGGIAIRGELDVPVGDAHFKYIMVPAGDGTYKPVPKTIL